MLHSVCWQTLFWWVCHTHDILPAHQVSCPSSGDPSAIAELAEGYTWLGLSCSSLGAVGRAPMRQGVANKEEKLKAVISQITSRCAGRSLAEGFVSQPSALTAMSQLGIGNGEHAALRHRLGTPGHSPSEPLCRGKVRQLWAANGPGLLVCPPGAEAQPKERPFCSCRPDH